MTLLCPLCESERFKILDAITIGPDVYWDERTVQRAHCPACHTCFICIYQSKRSFNPDRDDKEEHVAYENQSLAWFLGRFVFAKPQSRISPRWRRVLMRKILKRCLGTGNSPPMPIVYVPPPKAKTGGS